MNTTTVTTPNELETRVERVFDAPRAHVFCVWTDPKLIPEWWGDGTVVEEMDVRPGGTYRFRTAYDARGRAAAATARRVSRRRWHPCRRRSETTPCLAVVVGRPHDERGVAAGDTDAFRALRLDATPQVPGADTRAVCSTRCPRDPGETGSVSWMRARAWIDGFSSAQITYSPGCSSLPSPLP